MVQGEESSLPCPLRQRGEQSGFKFLSKP